MKKKMLIAVFILSLAIPALSFSAPATVDAYLQPGNLTLSVGVGFGYYWGFNIAVYPGVEFILAQIKIGDVFPLQFGVGARGLVNPYFGPGYSGLTLGAGAFGTVHLPLKGLDLPYDFLDPFDLYIALGLALYFDMNDYWGYTSPIGFATFSGFNYFLSDNFAVYLEGGYFGYYGGGVVGILLKL